MSGSNSRLAQFRLLTVLIRQFRKDDTNEVLGLANRFAAFDRSVREAGLVVTARFPRGFLVAEENGEIVGFVYGWLKDVPDQVLARWHATKVGSVLLMAVAHNHRRRGNGDGSSFGAPARIQRGRRRHGCVGLPRRGRGSQEIVREDGVRTEIHRHEEAPMATATLRK
ncbi:MAG: GNAT family N-acetyltransferase [Nitrososphaerota archaeon]|nr:GNAT family N-acetyltransferase [Nitrososphaerota archaeon]